MNAKTFNTIKAEIHRLAHTHQVSHHLAVLPESASRNPVFGRTTGRFTSYVQTDDPAVLLGYQRSVDASQLLGRLSWMHSWVWRVIRTVNPTVLDDPPESLPVVPSRAQLEAFAFQGGVSGWLDVPMYLAVQGNAPPPPGFGDWCIGDVVARSPLWESVSPAPDLQQQMREYLIGRAQTAGAWIEAEQERLDARQPPSEAEAPVASLNALRRRLRAQNAPRPLDHLVEPRLLVSDDGSLVYHERVACSCGDGDGAMVQLVRTTTDEWAVGCECTWNREKLCSVKLAAVDYALDVLGGTVEGVEPLRHELVELLSQPPWGRRVDSLVELLGGSGVPEEVDGMPAEFGWEFDPGTDRLYPVMIRARKVGTGVTFRRLAQHDWGAAVHDLDGVDRLVLRQLDVASRRASHSVWALVAELLVELAGHPRVYFMDGGARRLTIETFEATPQLDVSDGIVSVGCVFDGGPVPADAVEDALASAGVWQPRFDASEGVLRLYLVPERVRRTMSDLAREERLGEEGLQALVTRSAPLMARGLVTLSESTRGEERSAARIVTVDLELDDDLLFVRLRAMPVEAGTTFPIGGGPDVAYGADGQQRFWVTRDREAERELAGQVVDVLDLDLASGHRWQLEVGDEALELVGRLATLEERENVLVRWRSKPIQSAGTVSARSVSLCVGGLREWLQVTGSAALNDGSEAPIEQLLTAAREGRNWVEIRGAWAKIDEKLRGTLRTLGHQGELSPLATPILVALEEQGADITGDQSWREISDRMMAARALEPDVPNDLEATLRPYQRQGFEWLARLAEWAPGAVLADDMGLGKTVQALALMLHRLDDGPSLVVGPTSVCFNWKREAERFAPTLEVIIVRRGADLDLLDDVGNGTLVVTSYGIASRYPDEFAAQVWGTLVFDEAQALKNPRTQRSHAARQIEARFTAGLTGTPIENNTSELWSVFRAVVPGLFGSYSSFREQFATPIERDGSAVAARALSALVGPFILRRLKRSVAAELPERTDVRLDVELAAPERVLYDEFRVALLESLDSDDELKRFEVLAGITRLRQLACHPGLVDSSFGGRSSKIDALVERLETLVAEGQRALVFSQFTSLLDLVEPALDDCGFRVLRLDGSTVSARRGELVDEFQSGAADVFLLSTRAGGMGINLTAATAVFHLDPWWNPAVEDQATDRAHRIGQQNPVTVYRMISLGTIEEPIYEIHDQKRALVDSILAGSGSARALTPEELRLLIESHGYEAPDDDTPGGDSNEPTEAARSDLDRLVGRSDDSEMSVDPEALVLEQLRLAVRQNELAEGSANTYRPKAVRLVQWMADRGHPLTPEGVAEIVHEYVAAIESGDLDVPRSDLTMATSVARWVSRAFAAESVG